MVLGHFLKSMVVTFMVTASYFENNQSRNVISDGVKKTSLDFSEHLNGNNDAVKTLPKSEIEEIADELQKEIDELRKQINEILEQSGNSTSEEELKYLQKQMGDLQGELQECYKKLDQLSTELQQEFRQKLDELEREMAEANKKLEDRIKDLEEAFEKLLVAQCIGNLRDGIPHTAVGTFRQLKNPLVHIANIVSSGYQDLSECNTINIFLDELRLDTRFAQTEKNEVRALGYSAFYDKLQKDQFTEKGSDCTYKMAWHVGDLQKSVSGNEINAKNILDKIASRLPLSIGAFTTKGKVKLIVADKDREFFETSFPNESQDRLIYVPYNYEWTSRSSDGEWFMLIDSNDYPLISQDIPYRGTDPVLSNLKSGSVAGTDETLWKPVAITNEQFRLLNKATLSTKRNLYYIQTNIEHRISNKLGLGSDSILDLTIFKTT